MCSLCARGVLGTASTASEQWNGCTHQNEEEGETINKEEGARVQQKQLHSRVHMDKEEEADAIEQQQSQVQMYKVEIEQLHSQLNSYIQANFSLHP